MENNEKDHIQLPDNAFTELKPGEEYQPVMEPGRSYPEVNLWSVTWGIIMAMLFSAAAAYLGLKVGQVFEAAIPIAIIAVGASTLAKRKNPLGENVIIQSIGACSGTIVAGAIFTLPAIYILQAKYPEMSVSFVKVFMSSLLGGILGILFMIPFRKYFVKDMHGKYPFPEATATTQVLVSGAKGGSQAKPLLIAGLIGGLYDFIVATVYWWNECFTTRVAEWGAVAADKAKLVFKVNTGAAVLGLGYIIGLKYAFIICLGSFAVCLLGHHRSRCHLHAACHLHPAGEVSGDERIVREGVHVVAARRHLGHTVYDSVPQVLREGHARQVSLPRSHCHYTGARERSQGWLAG